MPQSFCTCRWGIALCACQFLSYPELQAFPTIGLVNIVPCAFAAQRIIRLLWSYSLALEELVFEDELEGAGQALEATATFEGGSGGISGRDLGNAQHIVAVGADF